MVGSIKRLFIFAQYLKDSIIIPFNEDHVSKNEIRF